MGEKNNHLQALIDDNMTFPAPAIEALALFKKDYRFNAPANVSFMDWQGRRLAGMKTLVNALCEAYQIAPIELRMVGIEEGASSTASFYMPTERIIYMVGKLSIVTLLHEFAHALLNTDGQDAAQKWAVNLYKKVYPRAFDNLSSGDGYLLVHSDTRTTPNTVGTIRSE
jgi:hypothetical protein